MGCGLEALVGLFNLNPYFAAVDDGSFDLDAVEAAARLLALRFGNCSFILKCRILRRVSELAKRVEPSRRRRD
jgi:hypothetical protein